MTIAHTFPVLYLYKCSDHAEGLYSETNMAENDFYCRAKAIYLNMDVARILGN